MLLFTEHNSVCECSGCLLVYESQQVNELWAAIDKWQADLIGHGHRNCRDYVIAK